LLCSLLKYVVFVAVVTVGDRRKERGQLLGPNNCLPLLLATPTLWAFRVPHVTGKLLALRLDSQLLQPSLRLLRFVLAMLFHIFKLKLFLLPNSVLAKCVNINISGRLAIEHNHLLLLLASRLILVMTCLPSLNQSLQVLLSFVKSPHGGHYYLWIGCGWRLSSMGLCMPVHGPARRSRGRTTP